MEIKIHRGTDQIGGNIVEISSDVPETRIILDCGRNLPPLDDPKAPDNIEIEGLTYGDSTYDAVFVTHHHADHCGLLGRVNNDIPIYMSDVTKGVLEVISDFIDSRPLLAVETVKEGQDIFIRGMKITPFKVDHSAKGAVMYLVEADGKRLLYTGDFNGIAEEEYASLGKIDAMLCEGTNIEIMNDKTEENVQLDAENIMKQTKGQVFVLCSTTNINRIQAIENACKNSKRKMAIDPFMKAVLKEVKYELSEKPVGFVPYGIDEEEKPRTYKHFNSRDFLGLDKFVKEKDLTLMVRQSMGGFLEKLCAKKAGLSYKTMKELGDLMPTLIERKPLSDSTLIYSIWSGYKETERTREFLNLCHNLGMEIKDLHVSGHAYRAQLEAAIKRIDPDILIPIHTINGNAFDDLHKNVVKLNGDKQIIL